MLQLLLDLLNIESYSGSEQKVAEYIISVASKYGVTCTTDEVGNVYGVRGDGPYILLNAHMDSVKGYKVAKTKYNGTVKKKKCCRWCANFETCFGFKSYRLYNDMASMVAEVEAEKCDLFTGETYYDYEDEEEKKEEEKSKEVATYNEKTGYIVGNGDRPIGGDDKCGIAIALKFIEEYPEVPVKLLFTVEEETGCHGAKHAVHKNTEWFQDIIWGLTLDRRGYNDICVQSCSVNNYTNLSFIAEIAKTWIMRGIAITLANGSIADVIKIREVVPDMVNLSVGYEEPHSNTEKIHYAKFFNIYGAVCDLILKSEINFVETGKKTREKMTPAPEVKTTWLNKEEEDKTKTINVEKKIGEATKEDIERWCTGSNCPKQYMVYELLYFECLKRGRTPQQIVVDAGESKDSFPFFKSDFLNAWVDLPMDWVEGYKKYIQYYSAFENGKEENAF